MQLESSGVVTLQSCRWNCRNRTYSWNTLNSQRGNVSSFPKQNPGHEQAWLETEHYRMLQSVI